MFVPPGVKQRDSYLDVHAREADMKESHLHAIEKE